MRKLFWPSYLEVTTYIGIRNAWMGEERWNIITKRPFIIRVSPEYRHAVPFYYLRYSKDPLNRCFLYALLPIWPFVAIPHFLNNTWWRFLYLLSRSGYLYSTSQPYLQTRFRDLRIGRKHS